jgi:hypothetical protein
MATRRIPDKVTDKVNYQRYWRDRDVAHKLAEMRDLVAYVSADTPNGKRKNRFAAATKLIIQAHEEFVRGWEEPYIKE